MNILNDIAQLLMTNIAKLIVLFVLYTGVIQAHFNTFLYGNRVR